MRLHRILKAQEIRQLEASWIDSCAKHWGSVLMEVAGRSCFEEIGAYINDPDKPILVLCGSGNNGGDGLVIARYLLLNNYNVEVYFVSSAKSMDEMKFSPDCLLNKTIIEKLGLNPKLINDVRLLQKPLTEAEVVIDAIFGTGLDRPLSDFYKDIIDTINNNVSTVIAVDLPSGVHADTGQIMGAAIEAEATITFGYLKPGLVSYPGAELANDIYVVDIGLPAYETQISTPAIPFRYLTCHEYIQTLLPHRNNDANKGNFGKLAVVAGSSNMPGAAMLAAHSAMKVGLGLGILASPSAALSHIEASELIFHPLAQTSNGGIANKAHLDLESLLGQVNALVLGPGLGLERETVDFVHHMVAHTIVKAGIPATIDADAINALAMDNATIPKDAIRYVFTPHPKELSRLTGQSVAEIQADRMGSATKAAAELNAIVVLKGAFSIIAHPQGHCFVNPTGNSGMATAGSGDVLSGIIGAYLAQGLNPFDAAVLGVYLHGLAGDLCAQELGEEAMTAPDIMRFLGEGLKDLVQKGY